MREIKFRAWDNNSSMMIEEVSLGMCSIGFPDDEELNEALKAKGFDPEIYELPENWDDTGEDWYRIMENYIPLQYTGLKDKNGIEIYEGDIVRILYTDWPSNTDASISLQDYKKSISNKGVVIYHENYAEYCLEFTSKNGGKYIDNIHEGTHGEKEVIGNIYENPELL